MPDLLRTLTVVEASRDVAVRHCGRLFARLGATVFRAPGGDDGTIGYGGDAGEAFGRWLDFGKRDGKSAAADLVIGGLDAPGLSAGERLSSELGAMHLEMRWFHPDGPYADWPGSDEVIQALTGLVYSFGPAEGPPTLAQGHGPQVSAALTAFNAAMGALFAQPRPRRVSVCVHEAHMCLTETGAVSALMEGGLAVRLGVNRFVPTYPCGSYPTTDGWLGVTALIPAQWKAFCELIGREAMAREPRYATSVERLLLADEIDPLVADAVSKGPTDLWVQGGLRRRIPLTPMADLSGLPQEPHWRQRGAFAPFDAEGRVGPTLPYRFDHNGENGVGFAGGPPTAPLQGLRVVDFSMGWAGPLCTRTLADLGADVIKIESEGHPDWWRGWETDQSGDPPPRETKFNFISVNRNKRGVLLDVTTPDGLAKAKALLAALWGRAEHGGAEIDLAQVACLFAYAADALIAQPFCEGPLPRTGSRRPRAAPTCVVRGLEPDTWLAVSVQSAEAWRGLCQGIGAEAWLEDPELATVAGRNRHADRIEAVVAAWAVGLTPEAAALALQAGGVAAAPALRVDQLGYDIQLASTGFWAEMERAFVGRYITPAAPFAYDGRRPALRIPAPTLGQHTDEVLAPLR